MASHCNSWLKLAGCLLLTGSLAACTESGGQRGADRQSYSDPHAYCAGVVNADTPARPYIGPAIPPSLVPAIRRAAGLSPSAPDRVVAAGSRWRCMNGAVYACFVGANLPCGEKADLARTPNAGVTAYCKANPSAEVVPMSAAGRATVFEWRCRDGVAEIVRQFAEADPRGFIAGIWYRVPPPQ